MSRGKFYITSIPPSRASKCEACGFAYAAAISYSQCHLSDINCRSIFIAINRNRVNDYSQSLMKKYIDTIKPDTRQYSEESLSCEIERVHARCLFCERPISKADDNWKCICGIRCTSRDPNYKPPVCNHHSNHSQIPNDYFGDNINYESLLVMEMLYRKHWINYKNKFLIAWNKAKAMSAIVIVKLKRCKHKDFTLGRMFPDHISTSQRGREKSVVMLSYDATETTPSYDTWRTLAYILKCSKKSTAFIEHLVAAYPADLDYDPIPPEKLHPPVCYQPLRLDKLCGPVAVEHIVTNFPHCKLYANYFLKGMPIQATTSELWRLVDMCTRSKHLCSMVRTIITSKINDFDFKQLCSDVLSPTCGIYV